MIEVLERLLQENEKMIYEASLIEDEKYKTGYIQALLNMKNSLEYELWEL
jgi:hypothetical protein